MKERRGIGVLNTGNSFVTLNLPPVFVGVFSLAVPPQCTRRHGSNCSLTGSVWPKQTNQPTSLTLLEIFFFFLVFNTMKCKGHTSISFSLETAVRYLGGPLYNAWNMALEAAVRSGFAQSACSSKGKCAGNVICHKSNVIFTLSVVDLAESVRCQYL